MYKLFLHTVGSNLVQSQRTTLGEVKNIVRIAEWSKAPDLSTLGIKGPPGRVSSKFDTQAEAFLTRGGLHRLEVKFPKPTNILFLKNRKVREFSI